MLPTRRITTLRGDVFRDEYSLAFDGSNDYVEIPSTTYDVDGGTVSFTFWAKRNDISVQNLVMSANNNYKNINLHSNGNLYIESDTNDDLASAPITQDTNWHHYVITCNSGTVAMYEDGISLTMGDSSIGDDITFNKISTSSAKVFNGNISEVAIYNCTLTANQVKTIYNGREPYNHKEGVASGNLQAWYRMGDRSLKPFDKNSGNILIGDETNITLGNNMVTNGTFDADSDWTKGTGWTIGSGVASASSVGMSNILSQDISAVTGKIYRVSFDITAYSGGSIIFVDIGSSITATNNVVATTTGHRTIYVKAAGSDLLIAGMSFGLEFSGSIDNVKVQLLGGNAGLTKNMAVNDFEGDTP